MDRRSGHVIFLYRDHDDMHWLFLFTSDKNLLKKEQRIIYSQYKLKRAHGLYHNR